MAEGTRHETVNETRGVGQGLGWRTARWVGCGSASRTLGGSGASVVGSSVEPGAWIWTWGLQRTSVCPAPTKEGAAVQLQSARSSKRGTDRVY